MKRKLLSVFSCLALSGMAWAQTNWTDKTSLIVNPSFEQDNAETDLTKIGWNFGSITGWKVLPEQDPKNSQYGIGNAQSTTQGIGASFTPGAGEKYFYVRCNWNAATTYGISQTIDATDLPKGLYKLTCKIATFSSDPTKTKWTLSLQEGNKDAVTNPNAGSAAYWLNDGVILFKESDETPLTISATMVPGAADGSRHYAMLIDDVQLHYVSVEDYAAVSSEKPLDMSKMIHNPDFNVDLTGWTVTNSQKLHTGNGFDGKSGFVELGAWGDASWSDCSIKQGIDNLPNGVYRIKAVAQAAASNTTLTLSANEKSTNLVCIGDKGGNIAADGSVVSDGAGVAGWKYMEVECPVTNGHLDITASSSATAEHCWANVDHFTVECLKVDIEPFKARLNEVVNKAQTLLENEKLPKTAKQNLGTILTDNNPAEGYTTLDKYVDATNNINKAYEQYNVMVAPYAAYKAMRDDFVIEEILNAAVYTDANGAGSTLNSVIAAANTAVEAATTMDEITAQTDKIREAALTFIATVTINEGQYFNLTKLMANPGFDENNVDGWTINKNGTLNTRVQCNEFYQATFDMYQTLTGLPKGSYTLNVKAFMRPGGADAVYTDYTNGINKVSAKLYVNNDESTIKNIIECMQDTQLSSDDSKVGDSKYIPNTMEGAQVYFGKGYYDTSVAALVSDGNLKLGFKNKTTANGYWTIFDDFRLYYYGTSELIYDKQYLPQLKAEAQATLGNAMYSNVKGVERTTLANAIAATPAEETEAAYETVINGIKDAQSAFAAALPSYNDWLAAKEEAIQFATELPYASKEKHEAMLTAATESVAQSAAEAANGAAAIRKAYRAYIESNAMAEGVEKAKDETSAVANPLFETALEGWVHSQSGGNEQILSGESFTDSEGKSDYHYYDYFNGDNNVQYLSQTLSGLTPGKYLLTVTARGATSLNGLQLEAGETITVIPCIGNTGGQFGRGWNDVSVEFEHHGSASDVTIGVRATQGSNSHNGWFSFTRVRLVRLADMVTMDVNIAAGKYATRIFPFAPDFGDADVKVFSCGAMEENGTTLKLEEVATPEANKPYILYSESGCNTTVSGINLATNTEQEAGYLTGVLNGVGKQITSGYVLQTQNDVQAFYAVAAEDPITIPQYRVYLTLPEGTPAEVNALRLVLPGDDDATAISEVAAESETVDVYSLSGVLVRKGVKASEALNGLQKGIYVVNGVKKAVK